MPKSPNKPPAGTIALLILLSLLAIQIGFRFFQMQARPEIVVIPKEEISEPKRIDVNRASAAELTALPHIGPVLARNIIEYRQTYGTFKTVEELSKVKGLGPETIRKITPLLQVTQ